jgi:hypothetical protein
MTKLNMAAPAANPIVTPAPDQAKPSEAKPLPQDNQAAPATPAKT